eukprot:Transcript_26582.p2 GENE.Transcript_26582~~Transcript_26582.p2  ORF type:complete len:818 (-),score=214.25 Transcript_26582:106-2436(-)
MPTQQSSKSSPRGRATARRDKKTRRKEGRAAKRKVVESRDEYGGKGSDDEGEPEKKKKKKKKKKQKLGPDGEAVPQKLTARGLKPKLWESEKLPPFRRDVRCPQGLDEPPLDEAATEELRKFLRLRVPEQRTRVCRFWQQGSCSRGDACGFAHSLAADAAPAARCPPPVQSLADPVLPKLTGRAMLHLGHHRPTPVQAQAWPAALAGHDLLCRAPTGTGKTLAYLLPAMAHAEAQRKGRPGDGPSVLVLVPTRELAMQVSAAADQLRKLTGLRTVALYGGAPRDEQREAMEGSVALAVCTTGRLLDMLVSKHAQLGRVTLLVLDEADLLISLGFEDQVAQVCGQLRPDRQTLLFSATFSDRLEAAAGGWLHTPLRVYAEGGAAVRGLGGATLGIHAERRVQPAARGGLEAVGEGGGEEQRLSVGAQLAADLRHLVLEAERDEQVRLVKHQQRHAAELRVLAHEHVEQPPGSAHGEGHRALHGLTLLVSRRATVERHRAQPRELAQLVGRGGDLHRELARRHEDKHARPVARPPLALRLGVRHRGQQVRQRLARARGRAAEQVVARQRCRPRLRLHRRRAVVAEVEHRAARQLGQHRIRQRLHRRRAARGGSGVGGEAVRKAAGVTAAAGALLPKAADAGALLGHAQPQKLAQLLGRRLIKRRLIQALRAPHVAPERRQLLRLPQLRLEAACGELLRHGLPIRPELLLLFLLLLLLLLRLSLVVASLAAILIAALDHLPLGRTPLLAPRLLVTPRRRTTSWAGLGALLGGHAHCCAR